MKFRFVYGDLVIDDLESQIAQALDKRVEIDNRRRFPGVWKRIDRLNNRQRVSDDILDKRLKRYKLYGIGFFVLGILMILISLPAPKGLMSVLLMGVFNLFVGFFYYRVSSKYHQLNKRTVKLTKESSRLKSHYINHSQQVKNLEIIFSDMGLGDKDGQISLPIEEIDLLLVTKDVYFIIYNNTMMPLYKTDLKASCQDFELAFEDLLQDKYYKLGGQVA